LAAFYDLGFPIVLPTRSHHQRQTLFTSPGSWHGSLRDHFGSADYAR